jgi:hypothetical protein
MENLIQHYKEKIELLKDDTIKKIQNAENNAIGEYIFILTGKMLAFEICLKELEHLIKYHNESAKA